MGLLIVFKFFLILFFLILFFIFFYHFLNYYYDQISKYSGIAYLEMRFIITFRHKFKCIAEVRFAQLFEYIESIERQTRKSYEIVQEARKRYCRSRK